MHVTIFFLLTHRTSWTAPVIEDELLSLLSQYNICFHLSYNFCTSLTSIAIKRAKWKEKNLKELFTIFSLLHPLLSFVCINDTPFRSSPPCMWYAAEQGGDVSYLELYLFSVFWQQHFTVGTQLRDSRKPAIPTALGRMQMGFKSYTAAHKLSGDFPLQILLPVNFQMFAQILKKLFPYKTGYFL